MSRPSIQRLELSLLRFHTSAELWKATRAALPTSLPAKAILRRQSLGSSRKEYVEVQWPQSYSRQSSVSPYVVLLFLVSSTAVFVEYLTTPTAKQEIVQRVEDHKEATSEPSQPPNDFAELFANMTPAPGFLGNLTPDQEQKLKEFWAIVLQTFGVKDPAAVSSSSVRPITPADQPAPVEPVSAKKEKHGLFHRKHKDSVDSSSPGSPGFGGKGDPEDKYGQTKELQEILASSTPASLRDAFWSMVKKDHPDALLLRFLRARKWDKQKALAMMISTMHWRANQMHVDDDVMMNGEGGALKDAQSSNASTKKEGEDFLVQMRMGKSFIHGIDKEGRPISVVRVRLHKGGEQTEKSLERFTVYTIETCRLALQGAVETAVSLTNSGLEHKLTSLQTIVFDMTGFTMANMDYTPVKFMIKVFEANYPESLGCVLVHKSPWIFQGIWKIIKGWLDPVVASKVHFTNNLDDLQEFIPRSQIITELGGDEKWEYKYVEPAPGENAAMEDMSRRKELMAERQKHVVEYEQKTFDWLQGQDTKSDRDAISKALALNYWQLDPHIRARSLYDRTGMIQPDGTLNFYPSRTPQPAKIPSTNGPPRVAASADDVD